MAKQRRQAKISYTYDRLWEQKLAQVYHFVVPDNTNTVSDNYLLMGASISVTACTMLNNEHNAEEGPE